MIESKVNARKSTPSRSSSLIELVQAGHGHQKIVVSRIICSAILLVLLMTDTFVPGMRSQFDDVFALGYFSFALVALLVAMRSWYADSSLAEAFLLIDTLAFITVAGAHSVEDTGAALSSLVLLVHIIFSSYTRGGAGFAFAIAIILNAFWTADIILFDLEQNHIQPGDALRWVFFAVVCAAIVLWANSHLARPALPRFRVRPPAPGLPLATSGLEYAMHCSHANGAMLCWVDPDNHSCCASDVPAMKEGTPPIRLSFIAKEGLGQLKPMLFDTLQSRAIVSEGGKLSRQIDLPLPTLGLLAELGLETGVCVPVQFADEQSWLFLTDIPMLGWGHIQLAQDICEEISHGLEWQAEAIDARDTALLRLRETVARDLHDSVAHSLAGAKYLLAALRSKVTETPSVGEEIDTIRTALDSEHLQVRRLIEQLREVDPNSRERNLVEDIDAILPILASRWNIDVAIVESDYRVEAPSWLSLETQQIVRETIGNAVRHGRADKIKVRCQSRQNAIKLEVLDNGSGFPNPEAPEPPRSINERVKELGGQLAIESAPGSTKLKISIPLSSE